MTQPSVTVEFSSANPGDAPVWVDITAQFRGASTKRGKDSELDTSRPGRATFTFSNADRKFDPEYSGSPLYPDWKPSRRIRVTATHGATSYPVFSGLIDSIRQEYSPPNEAIAVVECVDTMLEATLLPSSAFAVEMLATSPAPAHWWRLGESEGPTTVDAVTGGFHLTAVGSPAFGEGSLPINEPDGAVAFETDDDGLQGVFPAGTWPFTTAGSVEFFYRKDELSNDPVIAAFVLGPTNYGFDTTLDGDGQLEMLVINSAGTVHLVNTTGVNLNDLATHHIVLTFETGQNLKLYVDGVDRTNSTTALVGTLANTTDPWAVAINEIDYPPIVVVGVGSVATYDEVALYDRRLTLAEIQTHNAAARTAWRGDTSGERFERILDAIGWPAADRDIDTGQTVLASAELGTSALDHLNEVTAAEGGLWYVTRDGKVRFRERHAGLNMASSATFGDDPGELGYTDLAYDQSTASIANVVRRQRLGGVTQEVRDAASIAAYYERTDERIGLIVGGDNPDLEMLDAANHHLARYSEPQTRIDRLVVNPQSDETNLFPEVLGRELGDEITVRRRPQGIGLIEQSLRIEGMELAIRRFGWEATWSLSPAPTATYLQLDLSSGPGLDSLMLAY